MAESGSGAKRTLTVDMTRSYPGGPSVSAAIRVPLVPAEVAIVFGPSGAGKTTLLRTIAGLETPDQGSVRFGDDVWCDRTTGTWTSPQDRSIGYLFQDYALFPHLKVDANIAYGLQGTPRTERMARVHSIASRLGLDALLGRYPGELSGGQQQRVALARALVRNPALLLLDEPFAALDEGTRDDVRAYLASLLDALGIPAIIVTHDWVDALALGDRMFVMREGRVLQEGTPDEVLTRPAAAEVAAIAGIETVVTGRRIGGEGGTVEIEAGAARLTAVDPGGDADEFWIAIRGEDITLETGSGAASSARNRLSGTITEIVPKGPLTRVVLDVGFRLVALVTRQSAIDLALVSGQDATAVFKASIVHLIPKR